MTKDEVDQIKQVFDLFDPLHTGTLSESEVGAAMRALGVDMEESEAKKLSKSKSLSFENFFELANKQMSERDPVADMKKAFSLYDTEGTGRITVKELRKVAKQLGEQVDDAVLEAMIRQAATTEDQDYVDVDEFVGVMQRAGLVL
eukprot:GHVL01027925.1.p2 GENE.GHVL01027925.1~~GHVL01027925.1.p2  ORF type:complete len:145 (-),score=37.30 GHVL01027925.1:938-1372(-)